MSTPPASTTTSRFQECHSISVQCTVENSVYGYAPSLGGNAFFVAFFLACVIPQLYFGIRYKTWTYMLAMVLACFDQALGYAGRLMLHRNVYNRVGFQIQIICLVVGPAFNSAALYLVLKHITLVFGPEFSKIKPNWYTWIFIGGDLLSLIIQALGASQAATAGSNIRRRDLGEDLVIAGVSFQVVTLFFFAIAAAWYTQRRYHAKNMPLTVEASNFLSNIKFRLFVLGFVAAFIFIFIRCVFRIVEMAGGWRNNIMKNETAFIVLDGCMMAMATIMQTIFHPSYCFPRLRNGYVPIVDDDFHVVRDLAVTVPQAVELKEQDRGGNQPCG